MKLGPALFELLNAQQWVGNQKPVVYGKGGMSAAQLGDVERLLEFPLPEDFKYLLQNIHDPGNVLFPWERFERKKYDESMNWVLSGIEFDVENNVFWLERRWGPRPPRLEDCLAILRKDFPSWPKLLPLYGHRFLSAEPRLADNPVFSIKQTDIIYYGSHLGTYLLNEFVRGQDHAENTRDISRRIEVWSDIAEGTAI